MKLIKKSSVLAVSMALLSVGCATQSANYKEQRNEIEQNLHTIKTAQLDNRSEDLVSSIASLTQPNASISIPRPGRVKERRFNVNAKDTPLNILMAEVMSGSGLSPVLTLDAEKAAMSLSLTDVTWKEALDAMKEVRDLDYRIDGRKVYIDMPKQISRTFTVEMLALERTGTSTMGGNSNNTGVSTNGMTNTNTLGTNTTGQNVNTGNQTNNSGQVRTVSNENIWTSLKADMENIIGKDEGDVVTVNPMAGTVFVRAKPSKVREVENFLNTVDKNLNQQVYIEAKIVEVVLNDQQQTGINWSAFGNGNKVGMGALPGSGNINPNASSLSAGPLTFSGGGTSAASLLASGTGNPFGMVFKFANFAAMISYMESYGTTHVMSNPQISAFNNRMAVLKVGNDSNYAVGATSNTTVTTGAVGTVTTPSVNTQSYFSGVSFEVTPQISSKDNTVNLHIRPNMSSVEQRVISIDLGTAGTTNLPTASSNVQAADTIVKVEDGEIAVVGGLMRVNINDSTNGVMRSCMMGTCLNGAQKSELYILIKATVMKRNK